MRVHTEPLDPFLELMQRYRPCPGCGSERVTVQRLGGADNDTLRVTCADCGLSRVTPTRAGQGQSTSLGDS
jgi:transcription elongation factor Elf1